jgi:PIN domain nuclease of toxin-antitoxin system
MNQYNIAEAKAHLSELLKKAMLGEDISCWEMAIKCSLGKLALSRPLDQFIPEQLSRNSIRLLNMDFRHITKAATLPYHHRDPFDRLLIAQASLEKMTLVTADTAIAQYGIKCLW